jgi:Raf kinase inhibitor-like YbhB/YbcL family protein
MQLASNVFQNSEVIPQKYTCDGEYFNPPLTISDLPQDTKTLALIVEDPDAPVGLWVHWMIWNIPTNISEISEDWAPVGVVGKNSSNNNSWDDICPPNGEHRYFFKLFALDCGLDLDPETTTRDQFYQAMEGHVIEKAELLGRYSRE